MDSKDWTHVVPVNDLIEHQTDSTECPCNPKYDSIHKLVIHDAMDRRECFEPDAKGDVE